jgi:hypothetical protein
MLSLPGRTIRRKLGDDVYKSSKGFRCGSEGVDEATPSSIAKPFHDFQVAIT